MPQILTAETLRQAAREALLAGSSPYSADVVDVPSSNLGLLVEAAATVGVLISRQIQEATEGLWLGSASDDALDLLVRDRFDLARKGASPGRGEVSLSRPTFDGGGIFVTSGTTIRAGSVTLATLEDAAFGPTDLGPYVVDVATTRGGADQAVLLGTPTQVVGLSDPSIVAALVDDLAGADDEETDAELRERARGFWLAARRGTLAALEAGALTVGGVYKASAVETLDPDGDAVGFVEVFVADRAGRSNAPLAALVAAALEDYRPAGIQVSVLSGAPVYVPIRVRVSYQAGQNTSAKRDGIKREIAARVNQGRPGETLRVAALWAVLDSISGITVDEAGILEPAGDLLVSAGDSIRTRLDLIEVLV